MSDDPCPYEAAFDERFFRGDEADAVRTLKECFVPRAEADALRAENERLREALAHLRSDELRMHINSCCDEPDADLGWVIDEIIDEIEAGLTRGLGTLKGAPCND